MGRINSPQALEQVAERDHRGRDPHQPCITVCTGTGCHAGMPPGGRSFKKILARAIRRAAVSPPADRLPRVLRKGPLVVIHPQKILYHGANRRTPRRSFRRPSSRGKVLDALLYEHPATKQKIVQEDQVPFYQKQTRIIFGNNGSIDPTRIED